jgi:hypothetical protein
MSDSTLVVWDDVFTDYDFGPSHPLRPLRLELTMALAGQLGVLDRPGVTVRGPRAPATTCSSWCTTRCTSPRSSARPTT